MKCEHGAGHTTMGVLGSIGFGLATAMGLSNANGNGNGFLGGFFGGNNNQTQALMAENAMLRSENYSNKVGKEVYGQSLTDNRRLRDDIFAYVKPLADEAASNRERVAVLEMQISKNGEIADLREKLVRSELGGQINSVAQTCACGISQNNNAIAALQNTVNGITQTIIPQSVICPPVMPRYNSWTAPTATDVAPATQPISGTVRVQRG